MKPLIMVLLILPWVLLYNFNSGYFWDEAVYLGLANNLQHGEYSVIGKESFRAPLFPFLLAFFYPLGEEFLKIIPLFFGALSALLIYYFVSRLYNEKTAVYASFFMTTSGLYLFYGSRLLTEGIAFSLFLLTFVSFYYAVEKDRRFLPFAGFLLGLSFLAKYQAIIFLPAFLVYIVIRKKINLVNTRESFLATIIFILLLIPWIVISYTYYGDPFGSVIYQTDSVTDYNSQRFFSGPVYFYIINAVIIFGLPILLIPFFFQKKIMKKDLNKLLLISIIIILLFFSFSLRKEMRYLVSYSFIFLIPAAVALDAFGKKRLVKIIFSSLIILNMAMAINLLYVGSDQGLDIKNAAEFLAEKVNANDYIMAENYPVVNLVTGAGVIDIPDSEQEFTYLIEKYGINFVVVDYNEPTLPEYAKNLDMDIIKEFGSGSNRIIVYSFTNLS